MATAAITAGLTALPLIFGVIKSAIDSINHSKKPGVKLTPDQAVAANAAATQIAQVSLKTAVDNGQIPQSAIDNVAPNAQAMSNLVQMVYVANKPGQTAVQVGQVTVEQALLLALNAVIMRQSQ